MLARASFGLRGANLLALLRAAACAWFGIQTWIGGEGISLPAGKIFGSGWQNAGPVAGQPRCGCRSVCSERWRSP